MTVQTVELPVLSPERFASVLEAEPYRAFEAGVERGRELLRGRTVWNVNSTARGGGVAEMLRSLIAYARGADVDARWVVIDGDPDFFAVTKRIHNHLHGYPGDGGPLGEAEQATYRQTLETNADELARRVSPEDIVILHDPQTAGLVHTLKARAAAVIWRSHVGLDVANDLARLAWDFLRPHVEPADAYVFTRTAYAWERLDPGRVVVIPPSIDAFSAKNQQLEPSSVAAILAASGMSADEPVGDPAFAREDGTRAVVRRRVSFADGGPPPPSDAPIVTQVSRWDRLKDPVGVMTGFADGVAPGSDAHLVLAGPDVSAVADDPEGAQILDECRSLWATLSPAVRERIHLACLPMEDGEENAAIVNALQRRSDVVVQKSLAEGFGLTVTEAMWKARPVVATRIGGIQEQIVHGRSGVLIDDPGDLGAYADAVRRLLDDRTLGEEIGRAARARVRDLYLGPRHLLQYLQLFVSLLDRGQTAVAPERIDQE